MVATGRREQIGGRTDATTVHAAPFTPEDLARVRAAAREELVAAGTRMLAAGKPVDRVLVVGSGEVALLAPSPAGRHVAAVVRAGGVIGDIPLFLDAPMPFDAVVSRRARVCELNHNALQAFLASAPSASLRWMRSIAQRLDDDRRRLLAITTTDLTSQVAYLLLRNAEAGAGEQPVVRLSHDVNGAASRRPPAVGHPRPRGPAFPWPGGHGVPADRAAGRRRAARPRRPVPSLTGGGTRKPEAGPQA